MIHEGQQSASPKRKVIANRLKVERLVEQGRRETRPWVRRGSIQTLMSEEDLRSLLVREMVGSGTTEEEDNTEGDDEGLTGTPLEEMDDPVYGGGGGHEKRD